jgi:hypothetical protein
MRMGAQVRVKSKRTVAYIPGDCLAKASLRRLSSSRSHRPLGRSLQSGGSAGWRSMSFSIPGFSLRYQLPYPPNVVPSDKTRSMARSQLSSIQR